MNHDINKKLLATLTDLYNEIGEYIIINKLGNVHHNQTMKNARDVIRECFKNEFWKKVKIRKPNQCWNWTGAQTGSPGSRYGVVIYNGEHVGSHRLAYFFAKGQFLKQYDVCHSCDNTICCNPAHLFLGTASINGKDARNKHRLGTVQKISLKQANEIKRSHKGGKYLAIKYGLTESQISRIKNGSRWKK